MYTTYTGYTGTCESVERTVPDVRIVSAIDLKPVELDKGLPGWARRSNPIVRRHLGLYWKTILPETNFLMKLVVIQGGIILLTVPMPFLFDLALPTITAAILLFPFAAYLYFHMIVYIAYASSATVADEVRNNTFSLLMVTPMRLSAIFLSKIAAAIWRQVDDLGLLIVAAAILSLPILVSQYATIWPVDSYPVLSRAAMVIGLVVSLLRLALEPFMIGAIGTACGAALRVRSSAVMATLLLSGSYFLLLNLARLLPMSWPVRFAVEFGLPVVLPIIITWGAIQVAGYLVSRR